MPIKMKIQLIKYYNWKQFLIKLNSRVEDERGKKESIKH